MRLQKVINLVVLIGVLIVNTLATTLPIAGRNTGEISDMFPSLFTPTGFTFSIWGIIYLLLILFAVVPLIKSNPALDSGLGRIGYWFAINGLINMAWIFAWHHLWINVSLLLMILLLVSLIKIYTLLRNEQDFSWSTRLVIHAPFSVYLGWISVATIANVSIMFIHNDLASIFNPTIWMVLLIVIASALAIVFLQKFHDTLYALVVIWALYGIYVARSQDSSVVEAIVKTSLVLLVVLAIFLIWKIIRKERIYLLPKI